MLKHILVVIFNSTFLIVHCFAHSWYVLDPTTIAGTPNFSDLFFVNETTGWFSSSSEANIFKTIDGGATFSTHATSYTTNSIHMLNENEGYAGGASGFIYRTTDGGATWPFFGTMVATLTDISFPPTGDTGYACGINGNIHSISTNPDAVSKMDSGVPDSFSSLSFPVNSNEGWVCGGSIIRHYVNNAWTAADQDYPSGGYNAIYFVDNNNGWVVGDSGVIAHTTDGKNWTAQTNPSTKTLFDIFFLNNQDGWAVGINGTILHTTNGGATWNIEGTGLTTESLARVHFTSSTNGYVVGTRKTLIKFGTPLATEDEDAGPQSFSLSQNYPNPFNPTTQISYEIPKDSDVKLTIYNTLGKQITKLVNEQQQIGRYYINWNGQNSLGEQVPAGVYFYTLKAKDFTKTRKMLLLR